jgi:membrane-bound serine protease (ClpP class)
MMLFKSDSPAELIKISTGIIFTATIVTSLFFLFVISLGVKAQRLKVQTGIEGLIGSVAEVTEQLTPTGIVKLLGESWNAESLKGHISIGEKVKVIEMKNLKLYVEPI